MPNRHKKENYRSGRNLVEIKKTVDGKRKSFYGKTRDEALRNWEIAKEELAAKNALIRHGILPESDITFEAWAKQWLDVYKKDRVRDITYNCTYESPTLNHLIPYFGSTPIKDIKQSDIVKFFNEKKEYSYSQLSNFLLCIKGIFNTARDNNIINRSPAVNIKLPKIATDVVTEKHAYTPQQASIVVDFAKQHKYGIDILLMLMAGLRKSELLALPLKYESETTGGIDLENRLIKIRQSVSESKYGIEVSPCKTKKSIRNIPLSSELAEIIQNIPSKISYLKSGKIYDRKYVVSGRTGNIIRPVNWHHRHYEIFKRDFEMAHPDIPMLNPHELRHSFGSILYANGVDVITISKLMGHSNIEITVKLYVHDNMDIMKNAITNTFG